MGTFSRKGYIVDIPGRNIYYGEVVVEGKRIKQIIPLDTEPEDAIPFIMPGFIDSHVHIESSMLVPSEFARLAVVHGTVATVSDPHEIANVTGMKGIRFMIENGKSVPFKFFYGAPSCVPATSFETAGAEITVDDIQSLMNDPDIYYLSEMMNYPGVLMRDDQVMAKIAHAQAASKPVDGHAPGLKGDDAKKYAEAGISTDHECVSEEEAIGKLKLGMKILIREGSAAKNFDALIMLMHEHHRNMMFCSDDKHPDNLAEGHINQLCARAVSYGVDIFKVLEAACINPVLHYKLNVGMLNEGDYADFILVKDLADFMVLETYINGSLVAENGNSLIDTKEVTAINNFNCHKIEPGDLSTTSDYNQAITVFNGQLITGKTEFEPVKDGEITKADPAKDILKICVVNRYQDQKPSVAFIKNFGLKTGAIASSVAHDSHNVVAVGTNDAELAEAINLVIQYKGGVSAVGNGESHILPLPVAGLMSTEDGYSVADKYIQVDRFVKEVLGSKLSSPFMSLSFMALLVIPHLKLSDKGLFDADTFSLVNT